MTKEELEKLYQRIVLGLTIKAGLPVSAIDACRALSDLKAEFERYIDVLEPMGERSTLFPYMTTLDYYTRVIQTLNTEHRFDCDAVVKMLRRACDLIDTKKKPIRHTSHFEPITETVIINDPAGYHHLTFNNGLLTDYIANEYCSKPDKRYCPHCEREIE